MRCEKRIEDLDKLIDELLKQPQLDSYGEDGKKKGVNLMHFAKVLSERLAWSERGVLGVRKASAAQKVELSGKDGSPVKFVVERIGAPKEQEKDA